MGGGQTVVQPSVPQAPTAGQSAAEYAAALPTILQSQLQYQPQFDQATFDSYASLAPEYARVTDEVMKQYSPNQAALGEALAGQALQGAQAGLPDALKQQYLDQFKALAGENVFSGSGADFVSKNLLGEDLAYRQYNQNLGLSLSGKVPLTQAFQNPTQFQVSQGFGDTYSNMMNAYGSVYSGAGRPMTVDKPNYMTGIGNVVQGLGTAGGIGAFFCWVASEVFGGWDHPETCKARFFVAFQAPKWFREFYIKNGEKIARFISDKPILKSLIRPIFKIMANCSRGQLP